FIFILTIIGMGAGPQVAATLNTGFATQIPTRTCFLGTAPGRNPCLPGFSCLPGKTLVGVLRAKSGWRLPFNPFGKMGREHRGVTDANTSSPERAATVSTLSRGQWSTPSRRWTLCLLRPGSAFPSLHLQLYRPPNPGDSAAADQRRPEDFGHGLRFPHR